MGALMGTKKASIVFLIILLTTSLIAKRLEEGKQARDFSLYDLNGKRVKLSDYKGKKHVIMDFWATWCSPCRAMMPVMEEVVKKYAAHDVVVLSINIAESEMRVRDFAKEKKLTEVHVLLDERKVVSGSYKVRGIPHFAFVDKQGIYQGKLVGSRPKDDFMKHVEKTFNLNQTVTAKKAGPIVTLENAGRPVADVIRQTNLLIRNRQYQQAATELLAAEKNNPKDARIYSLLGYCYYNLSDFARSRAAYEKSLLLNPGDAEIKKFLAGWK